MTRSVFARSALWLRNATAIGGLACLLTAGASGADEPTAPKSPSRDSAAPRDNKDPRDTKDPRDAKDAPRDNKDSRDAKDAPRDNKDSRDAKDAPRDNRDPRDTKDAPRDSRDSRDAKDNRDSRDVKDARDAKDSRDTRDAKDSRDPRDSKASGDKKDTRDTARNEGKRRSTQEWGLTFGRATDRGVPLSKITSSSVAYKAGLRESDVIISVNGHNLRAGDDFERWVYDGPRTERVKIIVWRAGREEVIYLEPSVLYVEEDSYADDYRYFGVDVDDRYNDRIVVRKVYPDTPAYSSGLRDGDVITTWRGERVATPRDFGRIIQRTDPGAVKFEYSRDSKTYPGEVKFSTRATGPAVRQERREGGGIAPIRNR